MNEQQCLEAIAAGEPANLILHRKIPGATVKWRRLCKHIRKFITEVQVEFPDAQYYTASGGFNLMLGEPHSRGSHGRAQQELLALSGIGVSIGDGDF